MKLAIADPLLKLATQTGVLDQVVWKLTEHKVCDAVPLP